MKERFNTSIGGYFSLELGQGSGFMHKYGYLLACGSNALQFIIRELKPSKVWVPYFTCYIVPMTLEQYGIEVAKYYIDDNLEVTSLPQLSDNEYMLYTNYFGIKDEYVSLLATYYRNKLIVDNAHALYMPNIPGTSSLFSFKKYVGVPDGGAAYLPFNIDISSLQYDKSFDRCTHLLKRIDVGSSCGYSDYRLNEVGLTKLPPLRISHLSESILMSIDFNKVREIRRINFDYLHKALSKNNELSIPDKDTFACPMVYPFLQNKPGLKSFLIENEVFVATYWPNVLTECSKDSIEYKYADEIAFLPIDQRYDIEDMQRIIDLVKKWISE